MLTTLSSPELYKLNKAPIVLPPQTTDPPRREKTVLEKEKQILPLSGISVL